MRRTKTESAGGARPKARVAALRLLAQRRLTESQLWARLERKGYANEEITEAVEVCKRDGFVDDALFARLFVDGRGRAIGDARLVAELVRRGIDRHAARESVAASERQESERLAAAVEKLFRTRSSLSYPSAARALERLGFPSPLIYRHLRERAAFDMKSSEDASAAVFDRQA